MSYFGIPIRNGLPIGLGSVAPLASGGGSPFSPLSLFSGGAPGAWYDPSDYGATGTLFQDSAGTTPVTAVEQPVGLMLDKSQGLVLGSELVVNGDFSDGTTGWTANNTATISSVSGGLQIVSTAVNQGTSQVVATTSGVRYKVVITVVSATANYNIGYGSGFGQGQVYDSGALPGSRTFTFYFVGNGTDATFWFYAAAAGTYLIDNVSIKSLAGNHAFQATSASRPVLSARYNLLTKTEQFDDAVWTKSQATVTANATTAPDGTTSADKMVEASGSVSPLIYPSVGTLPAAVYVQSVYAKAGERSVFTLSFNNSATNGKCVFNLSAGTFTLTTGARVASASIEAVGNGWYRCAVTSTSISALLPLLIIGDGSTYTGDGASGLFIWGAQLIVTNSLTSNTYQRVNTATDYATTGFLPYLKFDGVDDSLSTNSISFTSTDKMSVFAGVRKLNTSSSMIVVELSQTMDTNNGTFNIQPFTDSKNYFASKGSIYVAAGSNTYSQPVTDVLTGLGDISGDRATLRINGAQVAQNTGDQGTGNYGNYPLFIGRRNNASLPFNGQMYSMIIVGKAVTAGELSSTEAYVNQKTGAY